MGIDARYFDESDITIDRFHADILGLSNEMLTLEAQGVSDREVRDFGLLELAQVLRKYRINYDEAVHVYIAEDVSLELTTTGSLITVPFVSGALRTARMQKVSEPINPYQETERYDVCLVVNGLISVDDSAYIEPVQILGAQIKDIEI